MERWDPYLRRYRDGEWRDKIFRDMVLQDVRRHGNDHGRPTLLDVGCGRGFDGDVSLQVSMADVAGQYIGVEPDPQVSPADCFTTVHRCLLEEVPLPAGSVHVAFAIMVLEHLAEPQPFWDKLWDVLADGGAFWGLTVDGRHWFPRASRLAATLKVKDFYLNRLLGERGTQRYENYPVYYRSNTPEQIRHYARRFTSSEFVNFSRVGQCNSYFPRVLHPLGNLWDRRALRIGKPGALLAVRAVK